MSLLSKMLVGYRKSTGIKQRELAEEFEVGQPTISKIEKGDYEISNDLLATMLRKRFPEKLRIAFRKKKFGNRDFRVLVDEHNKKIWRPIYQLLDLLSVWVYDFTACPKYIELTWKLRFKADFKLTDSLRMNEALPVPVPSTTKHDYLEASLFEWMEDEERKELTRFGNRVSILNARQVMQRRGQGGDVSIEPSFSSNRWIYIDFPSMDLELKDGYHYEWMVRFRTDIQKMSAVKEPGSFQSQGYFFKDQGFGYIPYEDLHMEYQNIHTMFVFHKAFTAPLFYTSHGEVIHEFPKELGEYVREREELDYYHLRWQAGMEGSPYDFFVFLFDTNTDKQ